MNWTEGNLARHSRGRKGKEIVLRQRKHFAKTSSLKLPSPGSLQKEEVEENMRHKRRRLLLKGDWVGTDVQKPIQMEFLKPRVSSRDDPWGSSRPRYQSSKSRLCRLLGVKTVDGQLRAPGTVVRTSTPVTRCQLRVRVGSLEKALDASSNATSSMSRYRDVQGNPDGKHS
ncbi:hypothetical protein M406DRAFT_334182 [Cryphonectria parasitica EP155]|uniref:Uncharacterized protein n=1 Tax=Cryphonectria parasitica (strain ATCC 38755 / EP155) TaxID=660469 RepID=A0A9P5CI65_CRYP1|nr:uncharacterized protein M406DRAFT_334182 [Cryphonectria parasitica EP155]KAF3760549.1 hypothetical protein M406DRAFT_334182 [Cryphonectria parasitica EP155]